MSLPVSLRTAKKERKYQKAIKAGTTVDISTLKGRPFYGTRVLWNDFELDAFHQKTDMLVAKGKTYFHKWAFMLRVSYIWIHNKHDGFDQILLNFKHTQSQPHIAHCHRCKLKERREDFSL